ncbi:hypothetical protein LXA43DRAFT_93312 [Ganoderma leucocontextum]|nr:hypothetical protein LXA43DRAFT_93312 [Ganoderma leucocontextum]
MHHSTGSSDICHVLLIMTPTLTIQFPPWSPIMPLSDTHIIAQENTNFIGNIITTGAAALIGYDYLLTVGRESRLFWKRKVNTASILFFVNRYLALFYYVALGYYRSLVLPYPVSRLWLTNFLSPLSALGVSGCDIEL